MSFSSTQGFIAREDELATVLQRLTTLRQGRAPQRPLLNFFGVYGVGKTALLDTVAVRSAALPGLRILALRCEGSDLPPIDAKTAALAQLAPAAPNLADPISAIVTAGDPADEPAADALLAELTRQIAASARPTLVLINAEERGAHELVRWLEQLLLPLAQAGCLLAVITSRVALRWRSFELRRAAESRELRPLTPAETAAQLGFDLGAAAAVQALTGGMPFANELVRPALAEAPDPAGWGAERRAAVAGSIVRSIYSADGIQLSEEQCHTLELLAVFRAFNINLLSDLPSLLGNPSARRHAGRHAELLRDLTAQQLLRWDQESLTYQVPPALRGLIAGELRLRDPERYARIAEAARAYFAQLIDEVPFSRHIQIVEYLYHQLAHEAPPTEPAAAILQRLILRYYASPDGRRLADPGLDLLRERLAADADLPALLAGHGSSLSELQQTINGLTDALATHL